MGKGAQKPKSSVEEEEVLNNCNKGKGAQKLSEQGEALNNCSDVEEGYKHGSITKQPDWKGSRSLRVFIPVCVVLVLLIFALLVTLTVVHLGHRLPRPEFFHVCPDTWLGFQGKCYYFSKTESNWTNSQESCEAMGASLALINTADELAFIKRYKGKANHWFGLRKEDDSWWWTNGTAFNNWFEVRGGGSCAYLNEERISSSLCNTKKNWLCSRHDEYVLWKQKMFP